MSARAPKSANPAVPKSKNRSRYAVLGLLAQAPASGYDIRKQVDTFLSHFWSESFGQIYPILKELADGGLANRRIERQLGKPDRQEYSLTKSGVEELEGWLSEPAYFSSNRNETLLKLFFGDRLSPDDLSEHVGRYRDHHLQLIQFLTDLERYLETEDADNPALDLWLLTIRHEQMVSRAIIRWCDEALEGVGKRRKKTGTRTATSKRKK